MKEPIHRIPGTPKIRSPEETARKAQRKGVNYLIDLANNGMNCRVETSSEESPLGFCSLLLTPVTIEAADVATGSGGDRGPLYKVPWRVLGVQHKGVLRRLVSNEIYIAGLPPKREGEDFSAQHPTTGYSDRLYLGGEFFIYPKVDIGLEEPIVPGQLGHFSILAPDFTQEVW